MSDDSISYTKYKQLMNRVAGWLITQNKSYKTRDAYGYNKTVQAKQQVETTAKNNYKPGLFGEDGHVAEYVECIVNDNNDLGFMPAYVTGRDGVKYYKNMYVSMAKRVAAYEVKNGHSPAIVYLNDINGNGTSSKTVDSTLAKFTGTFGAVTDFDSCLAKIQGKGYSYYYNSKYNTDNTISRIKNKQGVNCTDSSQLFYRLGIALGYTVQFVHVKCKQSGGGHIRLRLKHSVNTGGAWIYRDPAAVLKGNSVRSNWCFDGSLVAYDPGWIFDDLYQ